MIQQFFNHLLPTIDQFSYIGYWLAFFAALAETTLVIGLLLPGSSFLLLLGALSAAGHLEFSAGIVEIIITTDLIIMQADGASASGLEK